MLVVSLYPFSPFNSQFQFWEVIFEKNQKDTRNFTIPRAINSSVRNFWAYPLIKGCFSNPHSSLKQQSQTCSVNFEKMKEKSKISVKIYPTHFSQAVDKGVKQKENRDLCRHTNGVDALSMNHLFLKIEKRYFEKLIFFAKASRKKNKIQKINRIHFHKTYFYQTRFLGKLPFRFLKTVAVPIYATLLEV